MTKQEALKSPFTAFWWAHDNGPCDETRKVACQDSYYAYRYAEFVDKCPRNDTRLAVCFGHGPQYAVKYAYLYALKVDKCQHLDTWQVVRGTKYEQDYNYQIPLPPIAIVAPTSFPKIDLSDLYTRSFDILNRDEDQEDFKEDPNEGMIQNPITGEWGWL